MFQTLALFLAPVAAVRETQPRPRSPGGRQAVRPAETACPAKRLAQWIRAGRLCAGVVVNACGFVALALGSWSLLAVGAVLLS